MSSINANATVTLTVNGKQAQDMLDGLKKKSVELEKAIEKAAASGNKASLTKLQRELKQTNRQISQIESATVGVEKVMKNLDRATPKELNKTLSQLKKQLNGIERGTAEWNRQCEAIKRVKAEIDRVNADLRETEGRWSRFNRTVNEWQTTLMGAAAAVTGLVMAGRAAVSAYADMEQEMANVRKFTGMTADEVVELNEELKKIDTRTSREDLNKLAQEAGRLGKTSQEDVLGFVRAADKINVALDDLGEGATLTLSKLTNIFGDEERLGTEKALLSVGSVINELSQNCTASAPYLANFAQRLAGVGAQAKMTIPEIMGFAAVLDSQGQAVEMSATALSKLISDMFKDTDKIIKATGMNAKAFKEILAKDTNQALIMLLERLHELGNIDVLAPVFKDMGENGARASSVLAALAGNIETVKWEQEEANKAFREATSIDKEFDVQNNTVKAGLEKASKRVREVAVELGEKLMPVMRHVVSSTTLLLKAMSATISFFIKYRAEIITATSVLAAYAAAVNFATIKTKVAAAVTTLWAGAVKVFNVMLPIVTVLINGLKLGIERLVWQTRGANATQQAFNKSLIALRNNAIAAKAAIGLVGVAITVAAVALVAWIKRMRESAAVERTMNDIHKEAVKQVANETQYIYRLIDAAKNEKNAMEERQKVIKRLNEIIPGYNAQLDATTGKYKASKQALDNYITSLIRMAEVKGAEKKLEELGEQKAGLELDIIMEQNRYDEWKRQRGERSGQGRPRTSGGGVPASSVYETSADAAEDLQYKMRIKELKRQKKGIEKVEKVLDQRYGAEITKNALGSNTPPSTDTGGSGGYVPTSTNSTDTSGSKQEDKFAKEKAWKEKEEALNKIAYAKGEQNYEQYTKRMLKIEEEYYQKISSRQDLTEQERLESQVGYHEAKKKITDENNKQSVESENNYYNELVAMEKQRYIDGKVDKETYQNAIDIMELQHLKRMVTLYKEGTKERLQAEKAYQDKVIANQEKLQKESEQKEKEHQERLKELKQKYFGDNAQERMQKYMKDLEDLKLLYDKEKQSAGDDEDEKNRIEKAFDKARESLKKNYGIDDDDESWLEKAAEDVQKWLDGPGKDWEKAFEAVKNAMSNIFTQLTSIIQAETEIQTAAINKRYDQEISRAEGNKYKVKQIEKKKEADIAKIKNEANKKMFAMEVMQAVAQTATAAINAYSSAASIPYVGFILGPIAAAAAIAAGMLQVQAIKKQQKASEAQGYAKGGFTGEGPRDEVAGVVHKGEWVASKDLVSSPVARPVIDTLEFAQRTNTIGSLGSSTSGYNAPAPTVIVQTSSPISGDGRMEKVMSMLYDRLNEPFVTVNTVDGDKGIKAAQDEYEKLMRNKTPKSRRK